MDAPKLNGRPWYVEVMYAVGRLAGRLFRLEWYGSGAGREVRCPDCDEAFPYCGTCAGRGKVWKTNGSI